MNEMLALDLMVGTKYRITEDMCLNKSIYIHNGGSKKIRVEKVLKKGLVISIQSVRFCKGESFIMFIVLLSSKFRKQYEKLGIEPDYYCSYTWNHTVQNSNHHISVKVKNYCIPSFLTSENLEKL